jgi:hypothetical protein
MYPRGFLLHNPTSNVHGGDVGKWRGAVFSPDLPLRQRRFGSNRARR